VPTRHVLALSSRQLEAITTGAHHPDHRVTSSRGVIAALHAKGYLLRTSPETGRLTPAGLAVLGIQAGGAR
jgi:hypothetical protein